MSSEIPEEVLAKLEEMAKKVEDAKKAYEVEAAKIAEEHADVVKSIEADVAELQAELNRKKDTLKILKRTKIAGVSKGAYEARVSGGKADVLKWMAANMSVGDEKKYSEICNESGFHKSNVYGALVAGIDKGWVEKTGVGVYKLVQEISLD